MFSTLTFNMQNGQLWDDASPDDTPVDLDASVAFIQEQDCDIVFLQEVECGFEGGGQIEPPPNYEFLRSRLAGYHSVFGYPLKNPLELPFGLGLAIFSKTPLRNFFRIDLPPADIRFEYAGIERRPSHRLLVAAETEIEGRAVRLINTHLQAFFMIKASSNDHREQRDLVEQELRRSVAPTLLAGDFNSSPEETLLAQFGEAGFRSAQADQVTWKRMPFVVDHIFYNAPFRLESSRVVPTKASDHDAVRAEFSFV